MDRQINGNLQAPENPWYVFNTLFFSPSLYLFGIFLLFRKNKAEHCPETYAKFIDLISKMLECDPAKRISATDAAHHPFFTQAYNWCDVNSPSLDVPSASVRKKRPLGLMDNECRTPKKVRKQEHH